MDLFAFAKSYEYWIVYHVKGKFIAGKYDSKIMAEETSNLLNKIQTDKDLIKVLTYLKSDKYHLIKHSQNYKLIDAILPYIFEFKINGKKIGYKHYNELPYYVISKKEKKYFKDFKQAWNNIYENTRETRNI